MLAEFLCRIAHANTRSMSTSTAKRQVLRSYLQLNLKQWWQIDERDFHALFRAFQLHNVVKVSAKSVVQIESLIRNIQMQMGEQILLLVCRVRSLSDCVRLVQVRQPLPLLPVEQSAQ